MLGSSQPENDLARGGRELRSFSEICLEIITTGRVMSDEDFLKLLYIRMLRREPDATGLENHLRMLAQGQSRKQTIDIFLHSKEFLILFSAVSFPDETAPSPDLISEPPLPPSYLREFVLNNADVHWFLEGGILAAKTIKESLSRFGTDVASLSSILDFGCGCGRVIRHLRALEKTQLHGCDFNRLLVRWCKRHLAFAHFIRNRSVPPLPYGNESFDLIYALSVFTHLTVDHQICWIAEFSRILKRNGLLLLTTHGSSYLQDLKPDERSRFNSGQIVTRNKKWAATNLVATFHPNNSIENLLPREFAVREMVPEGAKGNPHQDLYLIQKCQ